MRIVSLLPSATEIICAIGLKDSLVGVTHECDYPEFVRGLPKVTRTLIPTESTSKEIDLLVRERISTRRALYTLDRDLLEQLRPDLIVTQALCDVCAVAESEVSEAACSLPGLPRVLNLEPSSLADVFASLQMVAAHAGVTDRATQVVFELRSRVETVRERSSTLSHRPRVVLLEWIDPPFSCGHWSPELVQIAGGAEQLGQAGVPSRSLQWRDVVEANPDFILIACCGFNVARTLADIAILQEYPGWKELSAARNGRVFVVDGNAYFSRPGPRLVESLELLAHALHPDLHAAPVGIAPALRIE